MDKAFGCIFWADDYRELTTNPEDRQCAGRKAAILALYDRIAASASNIVYLNEIYDNAEVELRDDNMMEITVMDKYLLRDLYEKGPEGDVRILEELTFDPNDKGAVGLMYARKTLEGPAPEFQRALNDLNREIARRTLASGEYLDSMMDKVNSGKIVAFNKAKKPRGRR